MTPEQLQKGTPQWIYVHCRTSSEWLGWDLWWHITWIKIQQSTCILICFLNTANTRLWFTRTFCGFKSWWITTGLWWRICDPLSINQPSGALRRKWDNDVVRKSTLSWSWRYSRDLDRIYGCEVTESRNAQRKQFNIGENAVTCYIPIRN